MDTRIALSGQQPNYLAILDASNQAAQRKNQFDRENQFNAMLQQNGAGILSGNQNALNSLAQYDPQAALSVKQTQQGMAFDREKMEMLRADARQKAARQAAQLSADQRAQQAEQIASGLKGGAYFYQRGDRAGYQQFLAQQGLDAEQYPFDQFPAIAASMTGVMEAFKSFETPDPSKGAPTGYLWNDPSNPAAGVSPISGYQQKPADEYQRYVQEEESAGRQPLNRIDYNRAKQKTTRTEVGPDGSVRIVEGFGGDANTPPKLTVDAAKNTGFLIRTEDANKVLNTLEEQGTKFWQQNAENIPMGLGNYFRSPEFQQYDQARRDFVNAILRRESGAVISDEEFDNANKQYFPMPGDSPEVIAQKRQNRINAIQGLRVGSGEGAGYVDQMNAQKSIEQAIPQTAPEGMDPELWQYLSDEEKALWK